MIIILPPPSSKPDTQSENLEKSDSCLNIDEEDQSLSKIVPNSFGVSYGSYYYIDIWEVDHYEEKSGKTVGIWPVDYSASSLNTLKNHWGYTGIFVDNNSYSSAISAGYSTNKIMISTGFPVGTQDYQNIISNYNANYYYIDEAVEHRCFGNCDDNGCDRLYSLNELGNVLNAVRNNRPNSFFVNSGYKRCPHLDVLSSFSDILMYSSYDHWYIPLITFTCTTNMSWGPLSESGWVPGDLDQRQIGAI